MGIGITITQYYYPYYSIPIWTTKRQNYKLINFILYYTIGIYLIV